MLNILTKTTIYVFFGFFLAGITMPSPDKTLFRIARSIDANEVHYLVNIGRDQKLDSESPMTAFWVKKSSGNNIEQLTWVQKRYSYGLKFLFVSDQRAVFQFVSYSKRNFELKKNKNGKFAVFTKSGAEDVEVERIFVQIDGGTFWVPKISRVELHAISQSSHKAVVEVVIP
jgi:hypothetical protein